jgi:DNA-binding MarR family transcriptional regulator
MTTTASPSLATVRSFRRSLRRLERLLSLLLERQDCCSGLSYAQCHPMLELEELGQATLGELAQRLQLDKSTMSRSVDSLVRQGMLQRTTHPEDRRFVLVSLTAEGKKQCREINRKNDAYFGKVLVQLPEEQRQQLVAQFSQLVALLEETPFEDQAAPQVGACGESCNKLGIEV